MKTLLGRLQHAMTLAIDRAFGSALSPEDIRADVAVATQEEFGHYQCNSALRLSKILKKSPRAVAEQIVASLEPSFSAEWCRVDIAGPGFINCTIAPSFLSSELQHMLQDPRLGISHPSPPKKIIVEFSSPNIAKELHVGHLRSTIIGDSLARLFEFLGHNVVRLNHLGDWGTQFGMLIAYMLQAAPDFKKRAQLEVIELQSGNPASLHAWKIICAISRKGFQQIYDLLNIRIEERGESFYNPFLKEVVEELEQKGLVTLSEGAKCIFLAGFQNREGAPLPLMIQKSDGGYNYDTTDMAAIRYRIETDKADRIIVVTDNGQSLHFQMVFKAAEKAGWLDPEKTRVDHVGFGVVLGLDGKKFKTRSGETEKLVDLLLEAVDQARLLIVERMPNANPEEIESLARVIGIGAVKYADLSSHRIKDYTFSYERMLRFEGNTAVFLLYAYVRINGIKRKTNASIAHLLKTSRIEVSHMAEIALGVHLCRFREVLENVATDLLPNRLAEYLYELAEKFNVFFRDCRVEGSAEESHRLLLCELTAKVLKQGLFILGLETVDRM
jgi:arginyl-tRNA synthetase